MRCRVGTVDELAVRQVVLEDEYLIAEKGLSHSDLVIDIGAHIGSFVAMIAMAGAGRVIGFEPNKDNFDLALYNARYLPGATVLNMAVWRSDINQETIKLSAPNARWPQPEGVNTADCSAVFSEGVELADTISLDDVLRPHYKVRLLKIDAEGGEWPILMTVSDLSNVQEIIGEFHEGKIREPIGTKSDFVVEDLVECLSSRGFKVEHKRFGTQSNGLFRAWR